MGIEDAVHSFGGLKEGASKVVDQAKNISARVGEKLDTAYQDAVRGVRKIKRSAEDTVDEARHKIKENPLAIVSGAALAGFLLGLITGYVIRARRD